MDDRPAVTLICLADGHPADVLYAVWATHRPRFDMAVLSCVGDAEDAGDRDRFHRTVAEAGPRYAVFVHGTAARHLPTYAMPGLQPPPLHVFLAASPVDTWGPLDAVTVPLTVFAAASTPADRQAAMADGLTWRDRWGGEFDMRLFDAGPDFLTACATEVLFLIGQELSVVGGAIPAVQGFASGGCP
ncbi:hypothetical protein [Micromonospora sp. NPDC005652]|uniref:hypothetical protein n=1 Tax=Micromonospora sp. NPDC005652 TaxID=3157046 RepID=UPI0033C8C964